MPKRLPILSIDLYLTLRTPRDYSPPFQSPSTPMRFFQRFSRPTRVLGAATILSLMFFSRAYLPIPVDLAFMGVGLAFLWLALASQGAYAAHVSSAISLAHEQKRFEALSLTDLGSFGATWFLCTSALRSQLKMLEAPENRSFGTPSLNSWITVILVLLILILFNDVLLYDVELPKRWGVEFAVLWLHIFALMAALSFDYVQTASIGVCIGILVPAFVKTSFEAQVTAQTLFVGFQAITYASIFLLIRWLLPALFEHVLGQFWVMDVLFVLGQVAVFIVTREAMVWILWLLVCKRLHFSQDEIDFAFDLPIKLSQ